MHAKNDVSNLRRVAAVFVAGRSIYKHMPGVDAFDRHRDALTNDASTPAVMHPPCRCWSKFLSHCAKPTDREAEMNLARWAVKTLRECGGVLEQPAHSALWKDQSLPLPGRAGKDCFCMYIEQRWFGFASRKPTWLCFFHIGPEQIVPMPYHFDRAKAPGGSAAERSRTMPALANWLIENARRANPPGRTCRTPERNMPIAWAQTK